MNIDSIKSKSPAKAQLPPKKKKNRPIKTTSNSLIQQENNRKKMWGFTAMAFVLIAGLWIVTLKVNIERINKAQSSNETIFEISNIKSRFNEVFKQTSQLIDSLNTSTAQVINSPETSSTTEAGLTDEQIKELSETLKSIIPTTTEDTTQP